MTDAPKATTSTTGDPLAPPTGRITVGVDDSDGARRALRWALALAEVTGATVQVVHVFPRHFSWIDGDLSAEELERSRRSALAVAERDLAAVVDDVVADKPAVALVRTPMLGDPRAVLVEEAKQSDLLVVGSRGRGGVAGLLLGSVSQRCIETAACPVVVVPPASAS